VFEESKKGRAFDEGLAIGPDPRETGLVLKVRESLLDRRELSLLDGLSHLVVTECPRKAHGLGAAKREVVARVPGLFPGVPNKLLGSGLVVKARSQSINVLFLCDALEAKLLGNGSGPKRQRLTPFGVVVEAREFQVIPRTTCQGCDRVHGEGSGVCFDLG
jgi:hypothetical protein